jgi:hypothetical protein
MKPLQKETGQMESNPSNHKCDQMGSHLTMTMNRRVPK